MKGRALRRAMATQDAVRVGGPVAVPLITDKTELITPTVAHEMLQRNKNNRPINWKKVEEYAETMRSGLWRLHAQGLVLDADGNVLTGQKRLWAIIYSGIAVHMRVSRGNPPDTARWIDRGTPQSSRDLASRETGRRHSPHEVSIARAWYALHGIVRPSTDEIATKLEVATERLAHLLEKTRKIKKTRAVLMILAVLLDLSPDSAAVGYVEQAAEALAARLLPYSAESIWGKGAAFGLAMDHARAVVQELSRKA